MHSNTSTRYQGLRPVALSVDKVVTPLIQKRNYRLAQLMLHWPDIIGKSLAKSSIPLKTIKKNDAIHLTIKVSDAGSALKFTYQAPVIIEQITAYFGEKWIDTIHVIQGAIATTEEDRMIPLPDLDISQEQQLRAIVAGTKDELLKEALYDLGKSILQNTKNGASM